MKDFDPQEAAMKTNNVSRFTKGRVMSKYLIAGLLALCLLVWGAQQGYSRLRLVSPARFTDASNLNTSLPTRWSTSQIAVSPQDQLKNVEATDAGAYPFRDIVVASPNSSTPYETASGGAMPMRAPGMEMTQEYGTGGGYTPRDTISPEFELHQQIQAALSRYQAATVESGERPTLRIEISELLGRQYDSHVKTYQQQVAELEQRLAGLREQVQKRVDAKSRLVALKLELLLSQAEGIGWPDAFPAIGNPNMYPGAGGPLSAQSGSPGMTGAIASPDMQLGGGGMAGPSNFSGGRSGSRGSSGGRSGSGSRRGGSGMSGSIGLPAGAGGRGGGSGAMGESGMGSGGSGFSVPDGLPAGAGGLSGGSGTSGGTELPPGGSGMLVPDGLPAGASGLGSWSGESGLGSWSGATAGSDMGSGVSGLSGPGGLSSGESGAESMSGGLGDPALQPSESSGSAPKPQLNVDPGYEPAPENRSTNLEALPGTELNRSAPGIEGPLPLPSNGNVVDPNGLRDPAVGGSGFETLDPSSTFSPDSAAGISRTNLAPAEGTSGLDLPAFENPLQGTPSQEPIEDSVRPEATAKALLLAVHNYHDAYQEFPFHPRAEQSDKLNWLVRVLPYLGIADSFDKFDFNQSWDSEQNVKLIDRMPEMFGQGRQTKFRWVESKARRFSDILDGTSNTIACIYGGTAVYWTENRPLSTFEAIEIFKSLPPDGELVVAFYDGYVAKIKPEIGVEVFKAMLTHNGGEVIQLPFERDFPGRVEAEAVAPTNVKQ